MDPINASSALPSSAPLTAAQQTALKKLHDAATQLEGVFVGMLFKEMHSTVPKDTIYGKQSNADAMWQDMLDEKQADAVAKTGSFGIAKMVESQLRAQVLGSASAVPIVPPGLTAPVVPPTLTMPGATDALEEKP
ncbi:MAG TPA: rod-binding protein [Candidatus Acidoferrales bacterium]|nr:rod-binding protein [Candidatus Acidoferrales bacterium]